MHVILCINKANIVAHLIYSVAAKAVQATIKYCIYMSYREGFHRILSLPTPIEGARHRPQGIAVHLLENFPVYKMPFLSSLQIF